MVSSSELERACSERIGFMLAQLDVPSSSIPGHPYRGIDRRPVIPWPDRKADQEAPTWSPGWEHYIASEEKRLLNRSWERAVADQGALRGEGVDTEVIWACVSWYPLDFTHYKLADEWQDQFTRALAWIRQISADVPSSPASFQMLGFDVAHPTPSYHSALEQPGLDKVVPDLTGWIGRSGLVPERDRAIVLCEKANGLDYGTMPFCVIGVWVQGD